MSPPNTMSLVKTVCRAMERIAPLRLAEKWDNVGLLLESPVSRAKANRVLLTIDLTPAVLAEARSTSASVIVAYHPPIFKPLSALTLSNPLQNSLLSCVAEGISVYSPHTALDSVWGGVNDWLGKVLLDHQDSAGDIVPLSEEKIGPNGEKDGAEGRLVQLKTPIKMQELERRIKTNLGLSQIQVGYADGLNTSVSEQLIRTIAVCAGSGGSTLIGKKADAYFTGEMSHHEVLASVASGTNVVLCGHTNTERGYLPILAEKLRHELKLEKDVEICVSQADKHPLHFADSRESNIREILRSNAQEQQIAQDPG